MHVILLHVNCTDRQSRFLVAAAKLCNYLAVTFDTDHVCLADLIVVTLFSFSLYFEMCDYRK